MQNPRAARSTLRDETLPNMIKFNCEHCGKSITAPDEYSGKKGKCPGCKAVVIIQDPDVLEDVDVVEDDVEVAEEVTVPVKKPAAKPVSAIRATSAPAAKKSRRPIDDDEDEDVPEAEEIVDEDDEEEEEERPRKKKKKKRKWRGEWAECPECGAPGDATRLHYTWWGGFIGPLIICHVRCNQCGTAYNGKTGKSNMTAIILWIVIPLVLGLGAMIFFGVLGALFGK